MMGRVQNVLNDFRIRDQMQPELIEDWLRERLEWEFVAAENDALERAVKALINCDGVAEEFPAALDAIRALKHSEHVN
jgi:hypothetical protein